MHQRREQQLAAGDDVDGVDGHDAADAPAAEGGSANMRFAAARAGEGAEAAAAAGLERDMGLDTGAVGVDTEDEPLQAQILSQKRLATYYGEVHIGTQPFKGAWTKSSLAVLDSPCRPTFLLRRLRQIPPLHFPSAVLFDTGSCEFWVPSVECEKHTQPPERCGKHSQYKPALSRKFQRFSATKRMLIQYLSGKVEGDLVVEDVRVGALTVPEQVVGTAETIDVPLLDEVRWDGILGLAYPSSALAKKGVMPFFDNVMAKRLVPANIFGYYLGPRGGEVTFGAVDRRFIQPGAEFVYAAVTQRGYWTVGITDIVLHYPGTGDVATGLCRGRPRGMCKAIIDTGTYLVYGPRADVKGALRDIQSSACGRMASLPSISFDLFAGAGLPPVRVTLSPKDYTLEFYVPNANVPADECSQAQYDHPDGAGVDVARCRADCVTGIAPDNDTLWTLGQVFLRNFYAVFDRANNRVGFVRSATGGVI